MNFADILRTQAQRHGTVIALADGRRRLSYGQLDRSVDRAARHLQERGVRPGDAVTLSTRDSLLHVVVAFAIVRLGAACCAIDWRSKPAERQALDARLGPRLCVTDTAVPQAPGSEAMTIDASWLDDAPAASDALASAEGGERAAFLLLSSGTTGLPKATIVSHRAASWRGVARILSFSLRPGMRVLSTMPLSTSAGLSELLAQLMVGASITFHPAVYSPEELVETLQRERIEHVALVPAALRWMLALPAQGAGALLPDLSSLLVLGAAFDPEEKATALARISPRLFENYGSAGTGTMCTATPDDLATAPASVGRPALFCELQVVDDEHRPVPTGAIGRVRTRSPSSASGYFGDTARDDANEMFRDGWVYPGDIGRRDAEGRLYLEGRAANLILRGGTNIYPEEIERVLQEHPAVAEAAIVGRAEAILGQVPVALVVVRDPVSTAALLAHCRARLQATKIPVEFRLVDSLPKTAAGKLHRAALPGLLAAAP